MKKLFREFFYVPKYGKVREKVMLTYVAMTVAIVLLCLAAMSFTAYAYFYHNITSDSSIIKAAHFETKITIQITAENGETVAITPITSNYQTHKAEGLEPGKYYTVTITPTERNTATTGFVIVSADGCKDIYHTQQLGTDKNAPGGKTDSVSFELMITDETDVFFLAHWGTSSYYDTYKEKGDEEELYITQGEKIKLVINGIVEPNAEKEDPENTAPSGESTPPAATVIAPAATETTAPTTAVTVPSTTAVTVPPAATETTPSAAETTAPTTAVTVPSAATEAITSATEITEPVTDATVLPAATETAPSVTQTVAPSTTVAAPSVTTEPGSVPTAVTEPSVTETAAPTASTEPVVVTEPQATEVSPLATEDTQATDA